LDSQAVGIVHPVASFRVNLARFPISVVPGGLRRAGLLLTPSLNPGIAFARSDFSDIAPSFTSFGPIFLLLPRFDYPAGTGSIAMLRSIAPTLAAPHIRLAHLSKTAGATHQIPCFWILRKLCL
jgi:hypothetical protein